MNDSTFDKTIIRTPHGKQRPYFSMSRATAQDNRLSWEARGVLAYLLSKPDDWELQVPDLQQQCGRDKVKRIIKELLDLRYLQIDEKQPHDPGTGKFAPNNYRIYETPFTENPLTANPLTAEPLTANPHLHNIDSTEQKIKTELREKEEISPPAGANIPSIQSEGESEPLADTPVLLPPPQVSEEQAHLILAMPSHIQRFELANNMPSHQIIDAYARAIGAPVIANESQKLAALRAQIAGYTPDEVYELTRSKTQGGDTYPFSWMITDLPTTRKLPVPPFESSPMLEAVRLHVFGIGDANARGEQMERITSWLSGELDGGVGKISAPVDPKLVATFAGWYKTTYPSASLPRKFETFVNRWREWAQSRKTTTVKQQPKPVEDEPRKPTPEEWRAANAELKAKKELEPAL